MAIECPGNTPFVFEHSTNNSIESSQALGMDLSSLYRQVRTLSLALTDSLTEADACLQAMADVSPAKWHLAHTTWFFEAFILKRFSRDYRPYKEEYNYLFNSYYNGIGEQYPRDQRGLISRPGLAEVIAYRLHVDGCLLRLMAESSNRQLTDLIILGLNHEQQHQELLLTDIKYNLFQHPSSPAYRVASAASASSTDVLPLSWVNFDQGVYTIGHDGDAFAYDNERPRHKTYLHDFAIASRPITNGEYLEFIESGAYQDPSLWLADGWAHMQNQQQLMPLYWQCRDGAWFHFTLTGLQPLALNAPVTHVSFYEAAAYAAWCGKRLPTEMEWEVAAQTVPLKGHLLDLGCLQPKPATASSAPLLQMIGDVWEWTSSSYAPYPGFKPFAGAAGEYNGKFMCNQYVLRGGSCVTPIGHIRHSYRNFFYAHQAWQFTGIRLAEDR